MNYSELVHSFPCISVSTDIGELTKPQDDKLEHFWIDFNVCSQSISFYMGNNKACLWESVRLQKESLNGYSLEECNGQKLLNIHLKIPQPIYNKEAKYIKISFEMKHAIQNATFCTYGVDLQMNPQITSPQQTDIARNIKDECRDSHDVYCLDKVSVPIVSDTCRVLEYTEDKQLPEFLSAGSEHLSKNVTTIETRGQRSAEKKKFDVFEFKNSSESASDIEMSANIINTISPRPSPSRATSTPNQSQMRSGQRSKAKMAVNYKEFDTSDSEDSWTLEESRRKSSAKVADYSRKKPKRKILPLSSQSSDEKLKKKAKTPKTGESSKVKKTNKEGVAQSLSFSKLNLPGVSGLLTPGDSLPQPSGTLPLSDQDIMDPLDDNSSASVPSEESPQRDSSKKINIQSREDKIEPIKELHPSSKDWDSKKRKRSGNEELQITLKPRKLFGSGVASGDLEDEVFHSDTQGASTTESSFNSHLESFIGNLKNKLTANYEKMEARAQDTLDASHQIVSKLMNQIQKNNSSKLERINTLVAQELSCIEPETLQLEKEIFDFWEYHTKQMNEFYTKQFQRIEATNSKMNEYFLREIPKNLIAKEGRNHN
ncbi:synaptonemal complex protein 2-like [Anomaloglossus baeobatrachus]|uniref:synaptonemal complex protein 2-like n=1 Tax=Anomaloglossus baeobatrachus TaxID=238106 RepID=UPI003F4F7F59